MKNTEEIISYIKNRLADLNYCRGGIGEEDVHYDERDISEREKELNNVIKFINQEAQDDQG